MADLDELLGAATRALRDQADVAPAPVDATRRRIMDDLAPPRRHRRRIGLVVFAFALTSGGLAWATATGRVATTLERLGVTSRARPMHDTLAMATPPREARATRFDPPAPTLAPAPAPAPAPTRWGTLLPRTRDQCSDSPPVSQDRSFPNNSTQVMRPMWNA